MQKLMLSGFLTFGSSLWAMPFKCDKQQTLCEVSTKRLTIGDKLGVFSSDRQLVALGEVVEIRGKLRMVKITQKWAPLYRSHEMEIIQDEEAREPERFFTIIKPLPELSWVLGLGGMNLGIGDSFFGTGIDGGLQWWWWRDLFLTARFHYLNGSGEASDNLDNIPPQSVSVSAFGLSAGISELLFAHQPIALRLDGDLGFSNAIVKLGAAYDEARVLNDRIADGFGLYFKVSAAAIWRREGIQPELGFSFLRLHQSNSPGLFVGMSAPLEF